MTDRSLAMNSRYPIGVSDFRELRERGLVYVDKTRLIADLLGLAGTLVVLLPRPRRFGKTLNLSMLRAFFEKRDEDLSGLFEGLHVWEAGERYRAHFQRYPTIFLTFKDVKAATWEDAWSAIRSKIQALFDEHRALLDGGHLSNLEARDYQAILDGTANRAVFEASLFSLSRILHRHHGEEVVLLIDEYDAPIHRAYVSNYLREALDFFRAFLTAGLKDNPHLFKAVLTGILRVARESIFSGLNNLAVYSLLRPEFSSAFGFTEPEVTALLEEAGLGALLPGVRDFYNGYVFGRTAVYNPWSILNFLASEDHLLRAHWVATSSNDLIQDMLGHHALALEESLEALLSGGRVERRLSESTVLSDLRDREDALWSLLVFSGYLRAEAGIAAAPHEEPPYLLSIPNREVREVYTTTFRRWMEDRLRAHGGHVDRLTKALLRGDAERLEVLLQAFATDVLSFHDAGLAEPELVYQGVLLGLFCVLEPDYKVRSNRESGAGRPDVLVVPTQPGRPGVVMELKVARPGRRTLEGALAEGLAQIAQNDYAAELRAAGATPIATLAVAFDGKTVRVERAGEG
jgi:hypothetical protein